MLSCEGLKLGDEGVIALSKKLPGTLKSLELHFENTGLTDAGLIGLASEMPGAVQSLTLRLSGTKVTSIGLAVLALKLPPSLEILVLHVSGSQMKDVSMGFLAMGLPASLRYLSLHLGDVRDLSDAGVALLAVGLPADLTHFSLDLSGCRVTDASIGVLSCQLPASVTSFLLKATETAATVDVSSADQLRVWKPLPLHRVTDHIIDAKHAQSLLTALQGMIQDVQKKDPAASGLVEAAFLTDALKMADISKDDMEQAELAVDKLGSGDVSYIDFFSLLVSPPTTDAAEV